MSKNTVGIVDYGVGNLFSIRSGVKYTGAESFVSSDPEELARASKIILPGVGAFGDAAEKLRRAGLFELLAELARSGKPLLGICLGMQLLFDRSFEFGEHNGLGLVSGDVCPLASDIGSGLKIPQIGWNSLHIVKDDPIFAKFNDGACVYYVHSYYAKNCDASVLAVSEYGTTVPGVVKNGSVYGCQFHPEKSGNAGLALLSAFAEMKGE